MRPKAWMLTVLFVALPALARADGVYYSPVFNMPLQPAPSPRDGGFYWITPDGRVFGPNYYLMPPFTPITGFDNTFVGQRIFAALHEEAVRGVPKKGNGNGGSGGGGGAGNGGGGGSSGPPPARQIGIGGYTMDYSDPNTFKNFNATAPMPNGYVPFGPATQPQPTYGNGPMPTPRYSYYPGSPSGYSSTGYAYQPMPQQNVYQAGCWQPYAGAYGPYYQTGYYGPSPADCQNAYWQNPIMQVQALGQPYCPPNNSVPINMPGMPCMPNVPGLSPMPYYPPSMPYAPNVQSMPYYCPPTPMPPNVPNIQSMPYYATPTTPATPYVPSIPSMPYYATPNYSMPPTCFPTLPNPSYEPRQTQDCCNQPCYYMNPMVRSPRDFWMWSDVQADKAARGRLPLTVP